MPAPSRAAILALYANSLRVSRSFSSYNFREYFLRRTKDSFRAIQVCVCPSVRRCPPMPAQAETDAARVGAMYGDAVRELGVLRRSAIVNQLYGGWKLAVEK